MYWDTSIPDEQLVSEYKWIQLHVSGVNALRNEVLSLLKCLNVICIFLCMHRNIHEAKLLQPITPHFLCAWSLRHAWHQDTCCRIQVVSTCYRQHVSCIGDRIVATKLSPVCRLSVARYKAIQLQVDRGIKWIVIMSPRFSQHVSRTSNLYPATCVRRHICIRIQVARPGYMFPGDMCPGVNTSANILDCQSNRKYLTCP